MSSSSPRRPAKKLGIPSPAVTRQRQTRNPKLIFISVTGKQEEVSTLTRLFLQEIYGLGSFAITDGKGHMSPSNLKSSLPNNSRPMEFQIQSPCDKDNSQMDKPFHATRLGPSILASKFASANFTESLLAPFRKTVKTHPVRQQVHLICKAEGIRLRPWSVRDRLRGCYCPFFCYLFLDFWFCTLVFLLVTSNTLQFSSIFDTHYPYTITFFSTFILLTNLSRWVQTANKSLFVHQTLQSRIQSLSNSVSMAVQ